MGPPGKPGQPGRRGPRVSLRRVSPLVLLRALQPSSHPPSSSFTLSPTVPGSGLAHSFPTAIHKNKTISDSLMKKASDEALNNVSGLWRVILFPNLVFLLALIKHCLLLPRSASKSWRANGWKTGNLPGAKEKLALCTMV